MSILFRKLVRDLKEAKGQFISIFVIIIIGVMFYTGLNSTFKNLQISTEKYYREYRMGDLWAGMYKAPKSVLERIDSLPYVKMTTGRVVKEVKIDISGENAALRLITLPDTKKDIVNDIYMKSGRYFSEDENNQCILEESFFNAHNLKIGDYITPTINGEKVRLKVIGSARSPEYVYIIRDGSELLNDNRKFGIAYVKESFGQTALDFTGSINDVSILLKDGTDIERAKDDVKKILDKYGVTGVVERKDQVSNRMISDEIRQLSSMGSTFPVIFFIVAAVIIYIMMGRMVENQRIQIGVLKALGYSSFQVLTHYLTYSVFIGLLGSGVGSVLGMYFGQSMTNIYNQYYNLLLAEMRMYPELAIPASLLTLFFCFMSGYNACKVAFRIMPAEAMRPKAPRIGRKILIERISALWSRLDFYWKIIMRNLFRYKRRAALTSVGIIFSAIILLMGFGMSDSIDFLIEQQFSSIQNYDIKVSFYDLVNIDELSYIRGIQYVKRIEPVVETGMEISNGWRKKDIGFTALIREPDMYKIVDKEGNAVTLPENGIMMPEKLARTLGVKPGDKVYLKPYLPGKEKKEVIVRGTIPQYLGLSAYGNINDINYVLGEGRVVNSVVIEAEDEAYIEKIKEKLREVPFINTIQTQNDVRNNIEKQMGAMLTFTGVIIFLAAVLAVAVVYNITTINIFERQRELATLKVLGLKEREVRKIIFNENYLITVFSVFVGLPLGKLLDDYLAANFYETDAYTIPAIKNFDTYLWTIVLTIAFTILANFILRKKIQTLSMVEVLKSNE